MNIPSPFSITFKKEIDFHNFNEEQINFLINRLEPESVEIIRTTKKLIEFKVPLFRLVWNWNIMVPVDHGEIRIRKTNGGSEITYRLSFSRFITIAILMSVVLGLISDSLNSFFVVLSLFLGLNWVIGWTRQKSYFEKMVNEMKNILVVYEYDEA